jgi:hypothetical protein
MNQHERTRFRVGTGLLHAGHIGASGPAAAMSTVMPQMGLRIAGLAVGRRRSSPARRRERGGDQ